MTVFVVTPINEATVQMLDQRVPSLYPKHHKLPRGNFLVATDGTSKDVATTLGFIVPTEYAGLVTSASGYWGAASNDLWEWINQNWAPMI
jgi:hypothetical protein